MAKSKIAAAAGQRRRQDAGEVLPPEEELTDRQDRFIDLYLGECFGNARRAAIGAGYAPANAGETGYGVLQNPRVAKIIAERKAEAKAKYLISADRIVGEYAAIAFSNILDYTTTNAAGDRMIDLSALTREEGAAVAEIRAEEVEEKNPAFMVAGDEREYRTVRKVSFKLHPKLPALEALAKYMKVPGIGTTKIELTNPDGSLRPLPTIVVNFVSPEQPAGPKTLEAGK